MPGVISQLSICKDDSGGVVISIPKTISALCGERPDERIRQFGNELGMDIKLEVV